MPRSLSRTRLALIIILLLAFALRMYRLDFFSLRGDESFTVLFVQKPLAQMWDEILTVEPNPPVMYFLLRAWIAVAGAGEFATRYLSAFFGVLCVALVYRFARQIFSPLSRWERATCLHANLWQSQTQERGVTTRRGLGSEGTGGEGTAVEVVGLIAAFLIAINPYQIWHSQDVRNYTEWPALSLLALVFFWRWYAERNQDFFAAPLSAAKNLASVRRPQGAVLRGTTYLKRPQGAILLFVLAELAALYTHYYEAFILLALNLFVFATVWRERRKLLTWLGAQVALAVLYLPYPLFISNRAASYGEGSGRQGVALWDIARETLSAFTLGDTLDAAWREWLWIPLALFVAASLILLWRKDWRRGLFFLLYLAIPTLAVFALNTVRPLYLERYLNGIAPAYYILIAFGIVHFSARIASRISRYQTPVFRLSNLVSRRAVFWRNSFLAIFILLSFLALSNYFSNPAYAKAPNWRGLTDIINAHGQSGDIIVQNFPEMSLLYYDRTALPLVVYPEKYYPDAETTRALNAMNANYQRVWLIPSSADYWDPEQFVEQWLNHRTDLISEWQVGEFRLKLYATPSLFLNSMEHSVQVFGDAVTLLGLRQERIGDMLRVVLYWRARENVDKNYAVRFQLIDKDGNIQSEQSQSPVRGAYPTTGWRKNEIVVDQHDLSNASRAVGFFLNFCDTVTSLCLPTTLPDGNPISNRMFEAAPHSASSP